MGAFALGYLFGLSPPAPTSVGLPLCCGEPGEAPSASVDGHPSHVGVLIPAARLSLLLRGADALGWPSRAGVCTRRSQSSPLAQEAVRR